MKERIFVFVNGRSVELYRGMKVKHALIAHGDGLYEACKEGKATVRNKDGFVLGLDGALEEGTELHVMSNGDGLRGIDDP